MKRKGDKAKGMKDKKRIVLVILGNVLLIIGFLLYKSLPFSIWKVFFLIFLISTFVFLNAQLLNLNKDIPKIATWLILLFLTSIYIAVYSYLSIIQYNAFHTGHHDLAVFDEAIWNTIEGRILNTSVTLGYNFLGEHFSPMLLILAPFYFIWQDPRMLLILQSLFLGIGAIPIFLIAKDKLKHNLLSLSFSFAYLFHPFISRVNLFEFHEICLAPFFLLFTFYFLQRRIWWFYFIFLFFSLMVKEDVSLITTALGIYSFFKINKKIGIITFIIGIFWVYISVSILMPYIKKETATTMVDSTYKHFGRFNLGKSPSEIIKNLIFNPQNISEVLFFLANEKLATIILLILPLGLLSIFSPVILISLPEIILHFLSIFPYQFLLGWQYSAPILPFAIISAGYGCFILLKRWPHLAFSLSIYILIIAFLSNYFFGMKLLTPITDRCYNPASYNPDNHQVILSISKEKLKEYCKIKRKGNLFETLKKIVPNERTISVVDNIVAHFSQRKTFFYLFPSYEKADYVVINTYGVKEGWVQTWGSGEEIEKELDRFLKNQGFRVLFTDEPRGGRIFLFGRKNCKEEVIKRAEKLVKFNSSSQEAHFILGSVYFYSDNFERAINEFQKVLQIDLQNNQAKRYLEECKKVLDKKTPK
ncbi:MAG: DUF2079 domain-containing protein [bacterium]